jgi:tetratricopeptide (TPR) repeat protein
MKRTITPLLAALIATAALSPSEAARTKGRTSSKAVGSAEAKALIAKGSAAVRENQFSQAIAVLEQATRCDSSSSEAFFRLADAYYRRAFQRGTPEKADRDDAQNAVDAFQTAVSLDSELKGISDPYLLYHGFGLSLQALGRNDEALSAFRSATLASPKNPMPNLYAAALRFQMGDFPMSSMNLEASIKRARSRGVYPALSKLVRTDPLFSGLLAVPKNLALLNAFDSVQAGTLTEGEAGERLAYASQFRDSVRDVPSSAGSRPPSMDAAQSADPQVQEALDLADNHFQSLRFSEAIEEYQKALDLDARKGTLDASAKSLALERLGASYRQLGLASEAVRILERAVSELPQNGQAYYQLSLSYAAAGKLASSLGALNKSLENAATPADLRKTLILARTDSELDPLRDQPRFGEILRNHSARK